MRDEADLPEPEPEPESFVPLPAASMYILTALAGGSSHGYRIMAAVEELSGGSVRLGPGTLYGSLKRMLAQGLVVEAEGRPDPELDDQRRRYYELTDLGSRVAAAELQRLEALARAARRRLGGAAPASIGWQT